MEPNQRTNRITKNCSALFMMTMLPTILCQGSTSTPWYDTTGGSFAQILAGALFMGFLGLVFWKGWAMKKGVEKSREMLTQLEDQIDIIEEETDEFVVKSIKDIREGIIFFENPMRLRGYGDHNTKLQEVHKKIAKLKKDVKQGEVDIADLEERNREY